MQIIKRQTAQQSGLNKYFTGKPCKSGHISERYVHSGVCIACLRKNVDRYRASHRETVNLRTRTWRDHHPGYYTDRYAYDSSKSKEWTKRWKQANPARVALMQDRRGALLARATPTWAEAELIKQVYRKRDELSKVWNIDLTVDHIIPIQSDTVCGLHCWANLQLIERSDNGRKHNKYITDW
jgi:5-methylcytosine-specific restriction endonuclease McrA